MIGIKKTTVCLALVAAIGILAAPAFAGLLGTGKSYTDSVRTWEGSQTYSKSVTGGTLAGHVEWAVFTADDFTSLFSDYTPTTNELVYAYQVFSTGSVNASKTEAPLLSSAPADHEGSFVSNGMSGILPDATSITSADVIWDFTTTEIGPPTGHSSGLVFSSSRKPRIDWYVVVDGGGFVNVLNVAGPGTVAIPEPSVLTLLAVAAGAMVIVTIRKRR